MSINYRELLAGIKRARKENSNSSREMKEQTPPLTLPMVALSNRKAIKHRKRETDKIEKGQIQLDKWVDPFKNIKSSLRQ